MYVPSVHHYMGAELFSHVINPHNVTPRVVYTCLSYVQCVESLIIIGPTL